MKTVQSGTEELPRGWLGLRKKLFILQTLCMYKELKFCGFHREGLDKTFISNVIFHKKIQKTVQHLFLRLY